jgi:kinetochore protein Nuf2
MLRLHSKSKAFLESVHFKDLTLADLLRPSPRRVAEVLSALINFLFYREERLALLKPIIDDAPDYHERTLDLKARIAQVFFHRSQFSSSAAPLFGEMLTSRA